MRYLLSMKLSLTYQIAIVGAGPLGLELAIALKQAGVSYIQFDKGQVAEAIYRFPVGTQFFSSSEKIGIAGMPIQTTQQQKCTREHYLAYIRATCMKYQLTVNAYETVVNIEKGDQFNIKTLSARGEKSYRAACVVLATGGTSKPRMMGIPGEDLVHVQTKLEDPHHYFGRHLLIIGGKNSAVEGALRAFHAGARVTLVTRGQGFDSDTIKYWLLPELKGRIKRREIRCFFETVVEEIFPEKARLSTGEMIFADFVVKAIGFEAEMNLFQQLKVKLSQLGAPSFNEKTMETNVEGVYVLGTAVAGTQETYKVYIENTHHHVGKIMEDISQKFSVDLPDLRWYSTEYFYSGPLEQ